MMSRPDFLYKQIIFYQVTEKETLLFRADNLLIADSSGKVRLQHSCHRCFALFIIGNITITNVLLKKARFYGFPIFLMSSNFHLDCMIGNAAEGNTLLRKKQYSGDKLAPTIARELIRQKIMNQSRLLTSLRSPARADRNGAELLKQCSQCLPYDRNSLMGREGRASRIFFLLYFRNFGWKRRVPRCKETIDNLLLDIGYTYLFNFMECMLALYGFDLYCGVHHTFFYQRKSLVCDLMEPFRCIIDRRLHKAHTLKQINPDDFFYDRDHWELKYQKQSHYIRLFMKDIMERKEDIFIFVRRYYLWYMRDDPQMDKFPEFII